MKWELLPGKFNKEEVRVLLSSRSMDSIVRDPMLDVGLRLWCALGDDLREGVGTSPLYKALRKEGVGSPNSHGMGAAGWPEGEKATHEKLVAAWDKVNGQVSVTLTRAEWDRIARALSSAYHTGEANEVWRQVCEA